MTAVTASATLPGMSSHKLAWLSDTGNGLQQTWEYPPRTCDLIHVGMDPLHLSAEEFRRLAGRIADLSADFLTSLDSQPIFPKTSGAEVERLFSTELPERGMGVDAFAALEDVIAHSR